MKTVIDDQCNLRVHHSPSSSLALDDIALKANIGQKSRIGMGKLSPMRLVNSSIQPDQLVKIALTKPIPFVISFILARKNNPLIGFRSSSINF